MASKRRLDGLDMDTLGGNGFRPALMASLFLVHRNETTKSPWVVDISIDCVLPTVMTVVRHSAATGEVMATAATATAARLNHRRRRDAADDDAAYDDLIG